MMKKTLSVAALAVVGLTSLTYAAQPLLSLDRVFGDTFDFGYTENQNITVQGFGTGEFIVTTPFLKDAVDASVETYSLVLGKQPMAQYATGENALGLRTELIGIDYQPTEEDRTLAEYSIRIATTELEVGNSYYGMIVPMDDNIQEGRPSKEFCFNPSTSEYAEGVACATFGKSVDEHSAAPVENAQESEHDAAGADMRLADISHSVVGNTITLTWTALPQSSSVEIRLFNKEQADYITLATVPMSQQRFEYAVDANTQEYLFAFIPRDSKGKEIRYDVNVRQEAASETPVIEATPKVGPVEDMLLIFAVSIALYAGYRVYSARRA